MLKGLLKKVYDRLLPSIDSKEDGTGHCHEAAFDPDSFPGAMKRKIQNQQGQKKTDQERMIDH